MITRLVEDVPTTPTSVFDLVGMSQETWTGIFFQAPASNPDTLLLGDRSIQPHELRPEANGYLPITNSKSLFFKAPNAGNKLVISFF